MYISVGFLPSVCMLAVSVLDTRDQFGVRSDLSVFPGEVVTVVGVVGDTLLSTFGEVGILTCIVSIGLSVAYRSIITYLEM